MGALLVAGNALPELDQHQAFLSFLLTPIIQDWTSDAFAAVISSPEALVAFGGLNDVSEAAQVHIWAVQRENSTECRIQSRWPALIEEFNFEQIEGIGLAYLQ